MLISSGTEDSVTPDDSIEDLVAFCLTEYKIHREKVYVKYYNKIPMCKRFLLYEK